MKAFAAFVEEDEKMKEWFAKLKRGENPNNLRDITAPAEHEDLLKHRRIMGKRILYITKKNNDPNPIKLPETPPLSKKFSKTP